MLVVSPTTISVLLAVGLAIASASAFLHFAEAGRWTYAIVFGLIVPLGAAIEWRKQRSRGEAAARASEQMLVYVALALLGIAAH
jgi:hypothetical protein